MNGSSPFYAAHSPSHLILKVAGESCNLRCAYCFELQKKESTQVGETVSPDRLKSFLRWMDRPTGLSLHGGEPLLAGYAKIEALLQAIADFDAETGFIEGVFVQTNGTLLNENWLDLFFEKFKSLKIEISISLDGYADMNSLRRFPDGSSCFEKIVRSLEMISERGQKAGVLSVLSKQNLSEAKAYMDFLVTLPDVRFVKINPLYNITAGKLDSQSITPSQYSKFLQEAFERYVELRLFKRFPVEPFLGYIQRLSGVNGFYCNFNNRKCLQYLSLYPDGRVGICDNYDPADFHFSYSDEKTFSECMDENLTSHRMDSLKDMYGNCQDCEELERCTGGCISQRMLLAQVSGMLEEYCAHRKEMSAFFGSRLGQFK